jgi:site-specific DNA recombinase
MTRTALYARVSTDEQAEKYGLASQVTELRALAEAKGYTIPDGAEFLDDGYSGAELDRPALTRLRDAVRAGAFDVILVHDPDRLARKLAHQLLLEEECEKAGVRLEFLTTPREATPEGTLLLHVKAVIGEYERETIRSRTLRGKKEKARRGLIPAGAIAYGYQAAPGAPNGTLVPDPEQAEVVKQIFRWLVDERRSIRGIVTELNRLGIRAPRSTRWAKSSVRRMLTNEIYMGRAYFNRRSRAGKTVGIRQESEWIAIPVPGIITEAVYQQAQAALARNRETLSGRPGVRFYLLKGVLRGACGRKYVGIPSHGRRIYRCAGRDRLTGSSRCSCRTVRAEWIEELVWSTLTNILKQPDIITAKLDAYAVRLGARDVEVQSEVEHLTRQLAEVGRQEGKLLDLYVEADLELQAVKARLVEIQQRKAGLVERIDQAKDRFARHEAEHTRQGAIRRFCRQALRGLAALKPEGQQRLLRLLVDTVVLLDKAVEIHGVLPALVEPPPDARNRTGPQEVVTARRGDLQRALGPRMAPHVGEIEIVGLRIRVPVVGIVTVRRDVALAVQVLEGIVKGGDRDDGDAADDGGLGRVARRNEKPRDAAAPAVERHRQHAADRPDMSVERELAEGDRVLDETRLDDPRGREDAERHRQVEGRAFLAELGGGEVDRDAIHGEVEPRVPDRGAHAITALAHGRIRQAHRREGRQARGHVHLDEDVGSFDAENRGRAHPGQHGASVGTLPRPVNDSKRIQGGAFC